MDIDIKIKVPAIEKLLDYAASGIGSVAGPMLAPWKAKREAAAKLITAETEASALVIIENAKKKALINSVCSEISDSEELEIKKQN